MSAHRRASRLAGIVMPASRGTSSKSPRFIRHWRRFGDFPAEGNAPHLALPLGELSPKVTERACRGFRFLPTVVPAGALPRNRLASSATGGASAIPAHRRASRLAGIVMPASRGTSSKSPRFIRHWRRFGDFPAEGNAPHLALPLGELSPKVTERACKGFRFSLSFGCADSSPKGGAKGQRGNGVSAVPRLNLILPAADSQPPAPPRPPGPNSPDPGATSWRSPGTPPPGRSAWPIPRPATGENYPMRWPPGG